MLMLAPAMIAATIAVAEPAPAAVQFEGGQFAAQAPFIVPLPVVAGAPFIVPVADMLALEQATPPAINPPQSDAAPVGTPAPPPAAATVTVTAPNGAAPTSLRDPNEVNNRSTWDFDLAIDHAFVAPVAHAYIHAVPLTLRQHLSLFIANLNEPLVALNDLLQLHLDKFIRTVTRFVVNSTVGVGGFFDVATPTGLPHHDADFGQTLGRWGVHPGPYFVIPLVGPSNVRDGIGFLVDTFTYPISFLIGGVTSTPGAVLAGAQILDARAQADPYLKAAKDSGDFYATARSAYAQRRAALVQEAQGKTAALPDYDAPQ